MPLARDSYLTAEVMTATPQKLHLMLIEGVIRLVHRAQEMWRTGQDDLACAALVRGQGIVAEILSRLRPDLAPQLVGQVAPLYWFVYRSLLEANRRRDQQKLDGALRVLTAERETWRQMCELLGASEAVAGSSKIELTA
jgi:flagellar protein FliS